MKADFDIGNLVYVILTIVFLVIGAMGKKKKPLPRVAEEDMHEPTPEPDNLKSQFQELFKELNPTVDLLKQQEYYFTPKETVEDGPSLDVVPELSTESVEDIIPPETQAIDSNINYSDQAKSSLDTTGMDEGEPAFDYEKDHSALVYNNSTKEYSTVLTDQEEEMAFLVDDFDPKTAFIYSEIFNRKEF